MRTVPRSLKHALRAKDNPMRSFSERALVIAASLIFLSIAYVVRHTLIPTTPVVMEPKPVLTMGESLRSTTTIEHEKKRWWSTPAPPADPVIAPAPLKPQSEG